ncbi:hypothetical protein AC1031_005683 [Aphanomyces cochlioides]|nr:hypothetical protein AC1031_005683 [Aphanomyces cochlioides]
MRHHAPLFLLLAVFTAAVTPWKMQTVRTVQARVQNSPPAWNATMGRWVGNFVGSDPYISPMDSMTTASVEGALLYIQQKLGNDDPNCTRAKNMSSIWIYEIQIVQPPASVAVYGSISAQVPEYGLFVDMTSGSCATPVGIPDECSELANLTDTYYGQYVGARIERSSDYGDYNDTVWFSYPNSCVLQKYANKTAECRAAQPGGLCPLGVAPDGISCTFNYTILGHIALDDLVGITNMTFKNDSTRYYKDRTEFCLDGRIEFRLKNGGTSAESDVEFWKDGLNRTANAIRSRKLMDYYNKYRNMSNMKALPTVDTLRAQNPPCYVNSPRCANSKYGCMRNLLAQVCQVCTYPNDPSCVLKPSDLSLDFPTLDSPISSPTPKTTLPPSPSPTPTPTSASLKAGPIVGALVVIGIVFFVLRWRSRRRWDANNGTAILTKSTEQTMYVAESLDDAEDDVNMEDFKVLRLDESKLNVSYLIGTGAYSGVWHGSYDGHPVAVKKLHPNKITHRQIQSFVYEIVLVTGFDSPYIVQCLGATWSNQLQNLTCVLEYMDSGDLRTVLSRSTPETLPWKDKLSFMTHMIGGLCYLHGRNVIHRDFKSRNLLVDSQKGLKLSDFGTSREDAEASMTVGVGTFRWMAPEVVRGHHYSVAADIYSFGMTLVELDTHNLPYQNMKNPSTGLPMTDTAILLAVGQGAVQPSFSETCPPWFRDLVLGCIAYNPDDRLTATQVFDIIQAQVQGREKTQ